MYIHVLYMYTVTARHMHKYTYMYIPSQSYHQLPDSTCRPLTLHNGSPVVDMSSQ